jgi:hypothetical protein
MNAFTNQSHFARLERSHGIHFPPGPMALVQEGMAFDFNYAMDAQPTAITVSNAGIPWFLSNIMDPKVITVLVTPNKAAEILGETKKGDWTTRTMTFSLVESVGETSSYGDWSNNGMVNANVQFPERQSYHYQTITIWGEKQLAEAGLAKIDWASRLNIASAMVLNKFQNNTYFYGVAGLQNYGLLNDPSLSAALTPGTKANAGLGVTWPLATANEIFTDIQSMYQQIASVQTNGAIDRTTPMVLALSPASEVYLLNTNSFGISATDLLKKGFPNLKIITAPQYTNAGVNTAQLIVKEVDGQEVGYTAFTEKMRAHPIVIGLSEFRQKKSQGSWGSIILLPAAISTMVGI